MGGASTIPMDDAYRTRDHHNRHGLDQGDEDTIQRDLRKARFQLETTFQKPHPLGTFEGQYRHGQLRACLESLQGGRKKDNSMPRGCSEFTHQKLAAWSSKKATSRTDSMSANDKQLRIPQPRTNRALTRFIVIAYAETVHTDGAMLLMDRSEVFVERFRQRLAIALRDQAANIPRECLDKFSHLPKPSPAGFTLPPLANAVAAVTQAASEGSEPSSVLSNTGMTQELEDMVVSSVPRT